MSNIFDVGFTESGAVRIDRLGVAMTPEHAIHLATHLLASAEMAIVHRRRKDSADCYRIPVDPSDYLRYLANSHAKG